MRGLLSRILWIAVVLGAWSEASVSASAPPERHSDFLVTTELRKQVEFWKRIYGEYGTHQSVIHDARYVDVVYEVVSIDPTSGPRELSRRVKAAKERWRKVLLSLHQKNRTLRSGELSADLRTPTLSEDERQALHALERVQEPHKFLNAAHRRRLRAQLGQKDRFREGLIASGKYLAMMEEVFRREGLPLELTRLPFVESSFNLKARSKVGARGIWQFMRSTGRLYLKIRGDVDERNDPIRATEAAARLLKTNYDALGNWPLAVTAYNHGRMGLMRAVRQVASNRLEDLIWNYRGRSFGFASQNFFTCLLAAIEIERESEKYFGSLTRDLPLRYFEVELPEPVKPDELVWLFKWRPERLSELRELNPALAPFYWSARGRLPMGYRLRLPLAENETPQSLSRLFYQRYSVPSVHHP
jgi:membrane-bound lytic murein transglycosylase D